MFQLIGIDWKYMENINKYYTRMRLRDTENNEIKDIPLKGYHFNFLLSDTKYCIGYFSEGLLHKCPYNNLIRDLETQCSYCERIQGFKSAFILKQEPNVAMKDYLSQPHYIYLAYFPHNLVKVGTASESRKSLRLIEQDALFYVYIAENNGFNIQELEHAISKKLKITETVRSSHKLKFLNFKLNPLDAMKKLKEGYEKVYNNFKGSDYSKWIYSYNLLEFKDLTNSSEIFFPESQVYTFNKELDLFGEFKGVRGRYLILKNEEYIAFDIKFLVGRTVNYLESYQYNFAGNQLDLGIL